MSVLSQHYPKARLIFSGFIEQQRDELTRFAHLGDDPARIYMDPRRPRTTSEDALYSAASLKPKPSERWVLVTRALHMPRAVGCFRTAGIQVEPYPVEFTHPFGPGSEALKDFDTAAKEWIGLVAYRLMGKTDALFPGL